MTRIGLRSQQIKNLSILARTDSESLLALKSSMGWALLLQILTKGSVLFSTIIYARLFTTSELGIFASMQAVMLLAVAVWDMGYSPMVSRDIAAGVLRPSDVFVSGLKLKLVLLPVLASPFLVSWVTIDDFKGSDGFPLLVLAIASLLLGLSSMMDAMLRGLMDFRAATLAQMVGRLILMTTLVGLLVLEPRFSLLSASIAVAISEAVVFAMLAKKTWCWIYSFRRAESTSPSSSLRRSWPFAMNGLFALVYNRADVLLVSILAGAVQAGFYTPASRIQDALMMAPSLAVAGLVQVGARANAAKDKAGVKQIFVFSLCVSLGISIPLVLFSAMAAPWLVPALLGEEYAASITPVRILMAAVPLAAVEAPILSLLIAQGHANLSTLVYASALVTSFFGQLIFTPNWGATGAAWASFLREPVALLVSLFLAWQVSLFRSDKQEGVTAA